MNSYAANPAFGPRLVFFTGGTALKAFSEHLTKYTHNSVHLVTPFDSGGSSQVLRKAFAMPAVGDIRNRLLALSDRKIVPKAVIDFFEFRFPKNGDKQELTNELLNYANESHPIWKTMPAVFSSALLMHLQFFIERMPKNFDLRNASMGNLLLSGGYLQYKRHFTPVLAFFARLLHIKGQVYPIVEESLNLAALLENGDYLIGQHKFKLLPSPVKKLFLTVHDFDCDIENIDHISCKRSLSLPAISALRSASAIIYPMGSFYTSVVANLLPKFVGLHVSEANCPKIFIPNSGDDPELNGLSILDQIHVIIDNLLEDAKKNDIKNFISHILIDKNNGSYVGGITDNIYKDISNMGIKVVIRDMVCKDNVSMHNPQSVVKAIFDILEEFECG